MSKSPLFLLALALAAAACTKVQPANPSAEPSWQATTAPSGAPAATQAEQPNPSGPTQYSAADVAQHATEADCWVSVAGKVYNVTGWINRHPGGRQAIIRSCGKDITAYSDSHRGGPFTSDRLQQTLAEFYVGNLSS